MDDRLLTPSKVTAWLDCAHVLTLQGEVADGRRAAPAVAFGSFARLLADKGVQHEAACLDDYRRRGRRILEIPGRRSGELFDDWVARVGRPFDQGTTSSPDAVGPQGMRGIADFLVHVRPGRVDRPATNRSTPSWRGPRPSPGTSSSSASTPTPSRP